MRSGGVATREIHCEDALPWLRQRGVIAGASIVTSVPDVSEIGTDLAVWLPWFHDAVRLCCAACPDDGVAVFFQTDLRRGGSTVDKAALVARAAEEVGLQAVFHKVVCRIPAGTVSLGRPGFTHVLAYARTPPDRPAAFPDVVVDVGEVLWTRVVGLKAVGHVIRWVRSAAPSPRVVVDPFCGLGTFPAVANALGMDAVGVERNRKRAAKARALVVDPSQL